MDFLTLIEQELSDLFEVTSKRKRLIRKGKLVRKRKCPRGYKVVNKTQCRRITGSQKQKLKRAGIKANRKGKAKRARNRKRSLRKRKSYGLDRQNRSQSRRRSSSRRR